MMIPSSCAMSELPTILMIAIDLDRSYRSYSDVEIVNNIAQISALSRTAIEKHNVHKAVIIEAFAVLASSSTPCSGAFAGNIC
jgi:hypothetical protein